MMTPMFIKEPFMNMTFQWPDAFYATINPQHAIIPKEIADKSIAIDDDILKVLKELLGKPTDSIRQFDKNNVFDPSKATAIKNTEERHKVFLRIATKALKR